MHPLFIPYQPILQALAPHPVYAVGGAVRAVILGLPLQGVEVDLCTPAMPDAILAAARKANLPTDTQGLRWGSIKVAGTDVTSFRADSYPPGSRHPAVVFGVPLEVDAARRDFTCNAVYLAPDGHRLDPYGGTEDLHQGRIVWLGNPVQKLAEDPLRWWRWLRFSAQHGMAGLERPTWAAPGGHETAVDLPKVLTIAAAGQGAISAARKAQELAKLKALPHANAVCIWLDKTLAAHTNLAQKLAIDFV